MGYGEEILPCKSGEALHRLPRTAVAAPALELDALENTAELLRPSDKQSMEMHRAGGGSSHELSMSQPCKSAPEPRDEPALQTGPARDNRIVSQGPHCGRPLISDICKVIHTLSMGKAGGGSPDGDSTQLSSWDAVKKKTEGLYHPPSTKEKSLDTPIPPCSEECKVQTQELLLGACVLVEISLTTPR